MRTLACLCLVLVVAGAAVAQEARDDSRAGVRPGDALGISVLGEKDLSGKVTVRDDGAISLPLVGDLKVEGLNASAIARLLSERLAEYIKDPQVTVQIVERALARVVVTGAVKSPGVYFVPGDSRIAEALGAAGGPTPAADLTQVALFGRAGGAPLALDFRRFLDTGDQTQNPPLVSGDNIRVGEHSLETDGARIVGKVARPGVYEVRGAPTPWDLIAEAGGLAPGANARQAMIKPRTGELQPVDLVALLEPRSLASAPVIKPGDTLVVPGFATQVHLLGGVTKPGMYYVQEGARLLEAISEAGGVTQYAVLDRACVIRAAGDRPGGQALRQPVDLRKLLVEGDLTLNVELRAGDIVFIPVRTPTSERPLLERAASVLTPLIYLLF